MKEDLTVYENVDFGTFEKMLGRPIDKNDFIVPAIVDSPFKFLFGTEENKEFLKDLLKVILGLEEEELKEIKYTNTEMIPEYFNEKKAFLDVRVRLENGTEIDIEIQRIKKKDLLARFLFYWSRMYVNQAKIGRKYRDLKKCISINILDFKLTGQDDCHSIYHLYEDRHKALFSDLLEIHLIELPMLENLRKINKELYHWLRFLRTNSRKEMEEMSEMSPELKKAMEKMLDYNLDGESQLRAIKEYNHLLDDLTLEEDAWEFGHEAGREEGMKAGREEGMKAGREEGMKVAREETSYAIARNLKKNSVDFTIIMEATGLSKEEVEAL